MASSHERCYCHDNNHNGDDDDDDNASEISSVYFDSDTTIRVAAEDDEDDDDDEEEININSSNTNDKDNGIETRNSVLPFSSGSTDKNLHRQNIIPPEDSVARTSGSTFSQLTKSGKRREMHTLGVLGKYFFDEKVPLRRKLKWLNRLATVQDDGTIQFEVPEDIKTQNLDFGTGIVYNGGTDQKDGDASGEPEVPPLQIVALIVGTRGDVQPFVAIGKRLQEFGHRVRLATHSNFKDFVLASGLEFFALGGDPKILAEYMVKNKGFLPSGPSEIHIQRNQIKNIIFSLYAACTEPDPESNVAFKVDAIIANPPAYGENDNLVFVLM